MKKGSRLICLSIFAVLIFSVSLIAEISEAVVTPDWVATYEAYGFVDIKTDSQENIYVTGTTNFSSVITAKYDKNGNILWSQIYNSPDNSYAGAVAIALDSNGNAYVTGYSSTETGEDPNYFVTIKYDTDGNELWVKRKSVTYSAMPKAISADASGNVYISGDDGDSGNVLIIKYDANGNAMWSRRYNPRKDGEYVGPVLTAMKVSSSGNVYLIMDNAYETDRGNDFVTVKYDTNGNRLWVKRYNGPYHADSSDYATALEVDSHENVYVTGGSTGVSETTIEPVIIKYDSNGNELWVKRYESGSSYYDARAIGLDAYGNIYISGWTMETYDDSSYFVIKYANNGHELWTRKYSFGDFYLFNLMTKVDALGNVYVTGSLFSLITTKTHILTLLYDTNGNEIWAATYGSESSSENVYAMAVGSGNVYLAGRSEPEGSDNHATIISYSVPPLEDLRPKISASPMAVNFAPVKAGATEERTVTVKNTGEDALKIVAIIISGVNASEFDYQLNDCVNEIPAGGSCTITVMFSPEIPYGKKWAAMNIYSDDLTKPVVKVKLLGKTLPPKISVSPRAVNFGAVMVTDTGLSEIVGEAVVIVKNTGLSDLVVNTIEIKDPVSGTDPNEFSQTNDCISPLATGDYCIITVSFAPSAFGKERAIMSIYSNDPKKPQVKVKLKGNSILAAE